MVLGNLKGLGALTLRGLVSTQAPNIFKGVLNEFLRRDNITVDKVVLMVQENQTWKQLSPDILRSLYRAAEQVNDIDWLTVEWLIEATKKEHPALASLFLSWRKARNWLARQIEAIKKELYNV